MTIVLIKFICKPYKKWNIIFYYISNVWCYILTPLTWLRYSYTYAHFWKCFWISNWERHKGYVHMTLNNFLTCWKFDRVLCFSIFSSVHTELWTAWCLSVCTMKVVPYKQSTYITEMHKINFQNGWKFNRCNVNIAWSCLTHMLWFNLIGILGLTYFLFYSLFWGMVMYDDESKTKGNKIKPRIKLNNNIYCT